MAREEEEGSRGRGGDLTEVHPPYQPACYRPMRCLVSSYALSGAGLYGMLYDAVRYHPARQFSTGAVYAATQSPVLMWWRGICCYAQSGTDVAYAATHRRSARSCTTLSPAPSP
eukprot:1838188-Rhodomonas_salina.1